MADAPDDQSVSEQRQSMIDYLDERKRERWRQEALAAHPDAVAFAEWVDGETEDEVHATAAEVARRIAAGRGEHLTRSEQAVRNKDFLGFIAARRAETLKGLER